MKTQQRGPYHADTSCIPVLKDNAKPLPLVYEVIHLINQKLYPICNFQAKKIAGKILNVNYN